MKYLTIEQAAEALAVSTDTIRRMLPRLGAVDLNRGAAGRRLIRIPERALTDYMSECVIRDPAMTSVRTPSRAPSYKLERRRA